VECTGSVTKSFRCRYVALVMYFAYPVPPFYEASTLCLQTERFISSTIALAKTISKSRDTTRAILNSLDQLRTILSTLLTPGLNPDVDSICYTKLGINRSNALLGLATPDAMSIYNTKSSRDLWCISGNVSATRLLAIVVVLKAVALYEGMHVICIPCAIVAVC
jgi:hypothetical protein